MSCYSQRRLSGTFCDHMHFFINMVKTFFYEHGEKAGCLLAHQLKSKSVSRLIPSVRKSQQELATDPQEINKTFKNYYLNLYTSDFPQDTSHMTEFLESLDIPTLEQDDTETLEKPLDTQEKEAAIKAMQTGKNPRARWLSSRVL